MGFCDHGKEFPASVKSRKVSEPSKNTLASERVTTENSSSLAQWHITTPRVISHTYKH